MSLLIQDLEREQLRKIPEFRPGDRVRVHFQVVEGTRKRIQVFEGTVLKRQGHGVRETFTVRKQSFGVGVERTFPVHSPKIEKIEVPGRGDVRRAKLYYLRDRIGKRARVRERAYVPGAKQPVEVEPEELLVEDQQLEETSVVEETPVAETTEAVVEETTTEETTSQEEPAVEPEAEAVAEETPADEAAEQEPVAEAEEAPAADEEPEQS